jgi:hypothetical protein
MIDFHDFSVRVMELLEVADWGEAMDLRFINRNAPDLVCHWPWRVSGRTGGAVE